MKFLSPVCIEIVADRFSFDISTVQMLLVADADC